MNELLAIGILVFAGLLVLLLVIGIALESTRDDD